MTARRPDPPLSELARPGKRAVVAPDLAPKVCALVARAEIRDYIDVAAAMSHGYSRARLLDLARTHDPAVTDQEVAQAMMRLDTMPDAPFEHYGMSVAAVAAMRERFADWPRAAEHQPN